MDTPLKRCKRCGGYLGLLDELQKQDRHASILSCFLHLLGLLKKTWDILNTDKDFEVKTEEIELLLTPTLSVIVPEPEPQLSDSPGTEQTPGHL